jgi:putative hydrolase of the HAD superfamily
MPRIQAVTFDLWDTVLIDDTDEPKRAAQGLPPKPEQRRLLVQRFVEKHGAIALKDVCAAYDATDIEFREAWYGENVTWSVASRLERLFGKLDRRLPDAEFAELVRLHEEMELEVKPDLIPGVRDAIEVLAGTYRLGVISDTIFSPGRVLRQLLDHYGILEHFDHFVFSDEIGCSKPNARVFEEAAKGLGVQPDGLVHLGDREQKDIDGAHQIGALGVLVRVACDRGGPDTQADAICDDFSDLPGILDGLNHSRA